MRNRRLLATLLAGSLMAQSQGVGLPKISGSAVWTVSPQFMATAHAACDKLSSPGAGECLIGQMSKAGAPPAAVDVSRGLYKQNEGEICIITGVQAPKPAWFALV